ncbi:ZIP family metal transporter [Xylophilus sp. GOD-11R]|uniref:ZIP family metal transporter n=1 Tax=Xylophilus sp. GOD-11R TaxID=3089814 RepID=UPI00298D08AD|nr:ZIP family metal transporter [Xylophilus sp. GOD-11R]WPB58768.1 ZIP family metal transporter [Xylophilus sp. GOD-11R]
MLGAYSASFSRRRFGMAVVLAAAVATGIQGWQLVATNEVVRDAFLGGLVAAFATALGTVPVLFSQRLSERTQDTLFGFGAGVMLAASAFSLIIPGIAAARDSGMNAWSAGGVVGASILLGGLVLLVMERLVPHEHFIKGVEGQSSHTLRRSWLFVFAIALHNLPEGLAIGVGFAGTDPLRASALATGIAIQDLPEGLVVAVALLAAGYSRKLSVGVGMASGLVEPVGALLGAAVIEYSQGLLPWGLGFAGGAMLFVISHEIIPESHRKGHEAWATGGLMIGFVLMMLLDTALG